MAKGQILYTDNLNEVKRRADGLHTSLKEVKKDAESLKTLKSTDGIFNNAFKGINNINKGLKEVRDSMKGLNQESKTYQNLQKIENQYLYQRKKIYSDLQEYVKLMTNLEDSQAKKEGEILQNLINRNKEQQQINNSIAASERILQRINNFEQQRTTEIKNQQKELDKLHKKAQEVGSMTKSILQDKNLNQKGAKDTAAQWDYQRDAIQRTAVEIRNAKDAGEAYQHMLESMVYEVKHTTGKGLFQDAIDGTNKLINLENKRFEAQKSGKQIMEKYYDAEIQKQKELISNIMDEANNPQKLQSLLKDNANYIKNLLPEDMQADFQQQFKKTGMIDKAWAEGMNKYVIALQQAYQEQVKLNQAKSQQNTQDTSYKTLKADLQEVWNLENKIAQLSKDPKHHLSEIQYLQQLVANKKQTLNYDERIKNLSEDQVTEIKKAEQAQEQLNGQIKAQGKDWENNNKKVSELGDTIKKVFNYILVYRGFQMLQQGIQQAIDTMKNLDKAFTDIQMVTGDTDEQTAELAQNYNNLAKEMGSTTQEVAEGASEWLRQGKSTEETTQLLKSSMTLSKVGAIESSEATELLTSSLNGYKKEANEAMSVVDKISSIDLAAATSSYELATALARTANSANDAGVSFDKLLAMIGTVSSVTRKSASTIGESFKTIFARMGNVAAGKDTDDMGEPLNDVEKTLNKMDIALRTTEGEWRNFETVLDEVATRWKDFNSTEQSQIATAIAGVRQQENFRALMNNWKEVERLTGVAASSTGSATERMGIYLDSIEAKTNNLKNAWEGFVMSLNQSESYKEFLDWLTKVVETLQFVDWKMVGIVAGVGSLITVILKLIPAIKTLITTIKTAGIAAGIASGGIVPLLGVIITLIGGVAAAWATASENSEKHLEDIKKNKEELENESKEARSLYSEYQKLEAKKNIYGLTEKEKSDLVGVTKTLVEQYGFEYDSIDSLTGAYNLSQKALESYNAEVKRQMDIYNSEEYNEYIDKAKNAAKDYRSASNKGRGGWMTFTDWVGDLFGGDKDENIKEAQSAGEFAQSLISALESSIQMETGEEISDELSKLLENAVISGFENLDEDKLKKLGEDEIRGIIDNVTSFISSEEFKTLNTEIENGFKRFDKKKSSANSLTIDDYRTLNKLYEQQASMAYGVEYKAYGDQQQAANDALKSLDENTNNLGSTLAYLNDYLKENKDITDKTKNNFELFSNDVLKLNKDFSDGKIQIQEYFDTLYTKMQNITPDNLNDTFGNFETYSAVMGNSIQSITSYMQQLIATLQSAEIESDVFTTKMVDTIQSLAKFSSAYGNMYKATQGEEKYNEVFGAKQGDIRTYKSETKNGLFGKDQDGKFKWIRGEYSQANFTEEETQKLQNAISNAENQHKDAYKSIEARNEYINKVVENAAGDYYNEHSVEGVTRNKLLQKYRNEQPEKYKESVTKAIREYDQEHNTNYKNDIEAFTSSMTEEEKQLYSISKQLNNTADAEDDLNKSTTEVTEVFQESSKSLDDNIKDMEKYANAIESWDVEKLDDAADILQKGFETGDLSKEGLNDFDKISQEYQDAAMTMAQGLVNMYTSAVELGDDNMQKLAEKAYSSLGLVAGASQEQIARSLVATQSTFSNSATNMNRIAQLAMAQSLKSASGTIEQMANAIGKISVTVPIKMGEVSAGIEVAGVKIASINLDPIDTKLTIGGEGTQISGVGDAIGGIADALANDALNSENPIMGNFYNPISPNYTPPAKNQDTPRGSGTPSSSGGGSKSGSGYSAEDAANDKKDILNDIEDYEADIELDLQDQTEELINHYNLEKNKLEKLKDELDYYNGIYDSTENTTKWLETQNKLLENQSKTVAELQNANDKIAKQREKIYRENSQYNVSSWFDSTGNETLEYGNLLNSFEYQKNQIQKDAAARMREEYNKIAGSTNKDAIEAAKERIKQIEEETDIKLKNLDKEKEKIENIYDSVGQLNDAWEENQEAMRDALQEMHDTIIDMRDTLIDQLMTQLEKAVDKQNESIEKDVTRMEQLVTIREKYYDILNETIDTQQELDSELQSSLDSFEYLDEQMRQLMFNEEDYKALSETLNGIQEDIAGIWEDHYNKIDSLTDDEMYKAEYITAETERQLDMKMKEYELAKAELDVAKAKTNLQNVQNERNVRMFINGQWSWVADPDAVKDAQQQLADAEREKDRIEREQEQQKLIDKMEGIIDSDNLQIDENNELLERVQEAIEAQTEEVKSIEDALQNIKDANLPALNDVLVGAFGSDGKSGWISDLLNNINKSTSTLTLALKGYTVASAENALKNGSLSQSEFEDLVSKLGYFFNPVTGIVTTPEGSFSAHYKGWTPQNNNDIQTGTAENGVQVTGGGSSGSSNSGSPNGFPKTGRVSTSSMPLRIRSGAGTNYKVLGLMPRGASVTITGEANSGWAKVSYNGINGYASRQYLTYDKGGLAEGKGFFLKDINLPERVLSPQQTKSFDKLVSNLTTNPVLSALTRNISGTSNLMNVSSNTGTTKQYYFSNFTVQSDNISEFIDSLDAIIPVSNK